MSTPHTEQATTKNSRTLTVTLLSFCIAVAVFLLLLGWKQWRQGGAAVQPYPPTAVAAMRVTPTDIPNSLHAVGSLRAVREVVLAPEVAGRVVSIGFDAGETVAAEQQLLQLYDAPEQADRAAALARVKLADAQLKRAARLVDSGAESREILDQRTAERDQALAAVKQLDARIAQKQIRAPFAGQLGIRQVDLGQYLNPGETIATLTDTSQLYVDFTVPQQELRWVQQGGKVQVVSDAWPDNSYTAMVTTVEPRISADTRNIQIRAQLDNPGEHLRPGMFVNTSLSLPEQKGQLVVPSTAIQTTAFGSNVLLVRGAEPEKAGQAEYVQVQISRRLKDQVVISSGLKAGDIVVTEGQLKVPPGAPVTVTKLRAAEES